MGKTREELVKRVYKDQIWFEVITITMGTTHENPTQTFREDTVSPRRGEALEVYIIGNRSGRSNYLRDQHEIFQDGQDVEKTSP